MSRQKVAKFLAIASVLIASVALFTVPASNAYADPIGHQECFPAVLMLRGSGETRVTEKDTDYKLYPSGSTTANAKIKTNGYEGPVIKLALEQVSKTASATSVLSKVRFIGIDYTAAPVQPTGPIEASVHAIKYSQSIENGANNIVNFIQADERRGCNTQYLLMGYSQGALSVRNAINLINNSDKILGTYLVGDPYQKANGATGSPMKSDASTGSDKDGSLRLGNKAAIATAASNPLTIGTALSLAAFDQKLSASDTTAYRNDTAFYSRSLCHSKELVCSPDVVTGAGMENHLNYFDPSGSDPKLPGKVDIAKDIPAFNSQLAKLASSQSKNPRARSLQSGLVVLGQPTTYRIANARPDDFCRWDVGSDGTFEKEATCDTYNANQGTATQAKMTVKVTDSFGTDYIFNSAEERVDPKAVEELKSIPYGQWVRFESITQANGCISIEQDFGDYTSFGRNQSNLTVEPCLASPTKKTTFNAAQVFKRANEAVSSTNTKKIDRYIWGYSDELVVRGSYAPTLPDSGVYPVPHVEARTAFNGEKNGAEVKLARVTDGIPYYQFKVFNDDGEAGCIQSNLQKVINGWDYPSTRPCDALNPDQLFKATPAGTGYGKFELEKDTTAPGAVTNLKKSSGALPGTATFTWTEPVDNRTDKIYKYEFELYYTVSAYWGTPYYFSQPAANKLTVDETAKASKIRVRAVDYAGNRSSWTTVSF